MDGEDNENPNTAFVASVAMIRASLADLQGFIDSLPSPDENGIIPQVSWGMIARMDTIRHNLQGSLLQARVIARGLED